MNVAAILFIISTVLGLVSSLHLYSGGSVKVWFLIVAATVWCWSGLALLGVEGLGL